MTKRPGLFGWYRVLPLLCVAIFGCISFAYSHGPSVIFKALYPLHYEEDIIAASQAYHLDPYLVAAVIETESGWDANAQSSSGAMGLMQLLPETAQDMAHKGLVDATQYDPNDLTDPQVNIRYGCAYLSYLLSYFNGAQDQAIAAYNAGMGNVDEWLLQDTALSNAITFPETQAYLIRVTSARERYIDLYPTSFSGESGE